MSCCGQNREKARVAAQPVTRVVPATPVNTRQAAAPKTTGPTTKLRYSGTARIQVKGPRTGRTYVVSGRAPDVVVDRRDADALMRIGLFQRAV
jgi:hypothetical protein